MSELLVVGLSHHTAPVELREQLAVPLDQLAGELGRALQTGAFTEALLVSTCNRVELYAAAEQPLAAGAAARRYLAERVTPEALEPVLYERTGADAVKHAFRVAASLDSLVVGEPQILGQLKDAFQTARQADAIGLLLGRCFHRAFSVAKRVRTETSIAEGSVSISSVACGLAQKIFGDLSGRTALLIGAGEMGEAAARALDKTGAVLHIINRSPSRAERLAAEVGGTPRGYEELLGELIAADVVITSTGSPRYLLGVDVMREVVRARRRRPLFVIDIAVPRDVDPRVAGLEGIFVYDVDDLRRVAEQNLRARQGTLDDAERIVAEEVDAFQRWRASLELTPTIVALRARFAAVLGEEIARTLPRMTGGDADRAQLERMCNAAVNKLLHPAIAQLKTADDLAERQRLIAAARQLFDLSTGPTLGDVPPETPDTGALAAEPRVVTAATRGARVATKGEAR
ncbi:MAG: glutamyl-tRNA reductase [Myxococcales bacterium]|nr:glutamyl-tRNA reductase [Myxococcales bacterium]